MSFAQHGNAVYLLTKSELQKVTFSAETAYVPVQYSYVAARSDSELVYSLDRASMGQLNGILHTTRETVESAPKSSVVPSVGFLKGLMGAASTQVLSSADQLAKDRDELCELTATNLVLCVMLVTHDPCSRGSGRKRLQVDS